jgi:tetratricopeptide (TPR) repeat protein
LPPNAKVELISAWPSEIPQPAALGAAYVLLHETMGPQEPALKKGVELLQQAVIVNPADVDSRHWLGSARLALGDAERARKEFQRVLEAAPTRHESRYRLGLAEEAAHKEEAAMVHYQRLLADVPSWTEPAMRLAQLRLQARQPREAAVVLRQVAEICPTAKAYASQALAERLAGASHAEAMTLISKAIALDSREAAAYVSRGTLLLLAGSTDGARDDFRRALRLDPGDAGARQALEALSSEKR